MKRFTVVTALFGISLLAVWMVFQASAASSKTENNKTVNPVSSGNEAAVPVTGAETGRIAPVYDATGALVSDPTGTILGRIDSADVKIAPIFDTTGAVVSDPTGTILSGSHSPAVPVTGANIKIAPVFDATGAVMSDPTGTLLNVNPK